MAEVIGAILPLAVGIAISPLPVIAAILMLLAPHARSTALAFLVGWILGILIVVVVFTLVAALIPPEGPDSPQPILGTIKIVLGALLLVLAVRQWRVGRAGGAGMPKWMTAIDAMTPTRALLLGLALSALNPKNLCMGIAAAVAIGSAGLGTGAVALTIAIFTALAASSVAVPVVAYLVAAPAMSRPLDAVKEWLITNNATVMSVLLVVLGITQIGKGIGNF